MKIYYFFRINILIFTFLFTVSCNKEWINDKPKQSISTPTSIKDLFALLDNTSVFNQDQPSLLETGTDNYYLTDASFNVRKQSDKNIYMWSKGLDFFDGNAVSDWDFSYRQIFYSNIILEQINKIKKTIENKDELKIIEGSALFFRALAFYNLAQLFAKPYDNVTAENDMGIILRLSSNINIKLDRDNIKNTYDQIIVDLNKARVLLPVFPSIKTRQSRHGVYALLSRAYLTMENYNNALEFADSCLQISDDLIDYNTVLSSDNPFDKYNKEVIYYTQLQFSSLLPQSNGRGIIDTVLYNLYDSNDLRKQLYFRITSGRRIFSGNYTGQSFAFSGLATDEIYFIKAECEARRGIVSIAMDILNKLIQNRFDNSVPFIPISANNVDDALTKILSERRKELCIRGLRWTDLRRLNKDDRFKISLVRIINGQTINLSPNDIKYVYPIPDHEILHNDISQNPR